MGETFRYVDSGYQDPLVSNTQMPIIGREVAEGGGPVMTTGVVGRTHLNVGWFDDVDATLDLERCAELGFLVIRRPVYGGGTAFYQEGTVATWAWLQNKEEHPDLDTELARFQPLVIDTLRKLGLGGVNFEGSSDLRIEGRKLGALTAQDVVTCNSVGGFMNIKPPDLDLYLEVVLVPEDKFKDKLVKDMREYVVTAEEIRGRALPYEEFRDALLATCEAAGMKLDPRPLSDEERAGIAKIASKIGSDEFIRRISSERFQATAPAGTTVGFGNEKGRKLCRAGVAVTADHTIAAAMMAGDMHVGPPDVLDRTAAALVGADAGDAADLRARIASVFEGPDVHQPDTLMGVTSDDLLKAVQKAVASAR